MGINEKSRTNDRFRVFITDKVNKEQDIQEYEILMDSETQRIRVHMNNGRGETDKYTIEVDGIKGFIRLNDDHKNEVCIITKDKHVYMINQDGTFVEVKETIAKVKADTKISLDTPLVLCTNRLHAIGTITSDQQILDTTGNTNHHTH